MNWRMYLAHQTIIAKQAEVCELAVFIVGII
jgi:hypothetical protein